MVLLPEAVQRAFLTREPLCVFATAAPDGTPNAVYILWARPLDPGRILIVNNRLHKTLANLQAGSEGALLFITPERVAYQIKGGLEYHTAGPVYREMKEWLDPAYPGLGAVVLSVREVYCGAERLA
jgi:predicted pyridoxine 5'-phosphate oxidase superfamily flavin-nucleotide-binding protein